MKVKSLTIQIFFPELVDIERKKVMDVISESFRSASLNYAKINILTDRLDRVSSYKFKNFTKFSSRIQKILDFTNRNYNKNISLEKAANKICLSVYHFDRIFKSEVGISFKKYLKILRLCMAAKMLRTNLTFSVTDICLDTGFNDLSNFINSFKALFGCSPAKFRNCCIYPQNCDLRKRSIASNPATGNYKLLKVFGFQLSSICYLKRARKTKKQQY
jgi:AraC-like DNA-binding protein